ncbi:MAG: GTP-binding protein [Bacteroidales bacterium]|nr:GTP-binding protein [Bacteroidales bacterium]MCM1415474.1 GTP-binding protein [bacterium]MCM1423411.1 GTP-binding protein [bacterium]
MTKIDIVSGFLGAGKTTLIRKLLKEALTEEKVVLIENEFGEIGIDGGFLQEAGIEIKEMNSGCICCSLVGDFGASLKEVLTTYAPERILIEPSGVGKLSDVMKAVQDAMADRDVELGSAVAVVDAAKCKMYSKNFGEFFINQIAYAGTVVLSRTDAISEEKLSACVALIREHNAKATIVTTPWDALDGKDILRTIEGAGDLEAELMREVMERQEEEHHYDHGPDCTCGCHDHDHEHGEHEHHHHDHDHEEHEHHHDHDHDHDEHEHHHDHDHEEHEHHHDHDHDEHEHHHDHEHDEHHHHDHDHAHHHHHADEVFTSWGLETPAAYTKEEIEHILAELDHEEEYGTVLRAKGMVAGSAGSWIYFDYVPEESNVRDGKPGVTGKFCVIGAQLKEEKLAELFRK